MYSILIWLLVGLGAAAIFLNLYFRVRVFRAYKKLVENRVEFGAEHIFSRQKLEAEILPKYPKMRAEIEEFVGLLRRSISMATLLIFIITAFGAVLMWFRKG